MKDCEVCDRQLAITWTDTHGVAQCVWCGAPYRILHYDENDKHVERPPTLGLGDDAERVRQFHADTGARVSAVGMGLSFPGGFDVATAEDADAWKRWVESDDHHHVGARE